MSKLCVIIPGFMGSQLGVRGANGPYRIVWVDSYQLAIGGPDVLTLAADGTSPVNGNYALYATGADAIGSTSQMKQKVEQEGWIGRVLHYDWRLSIIDTAQTLADLLLSTVNAVERQQSDTVDEIACVGHSMGGLLARLMYPLVVPSIRNAWRTTITLGSPHGGSYEAPMIMNQQDNWYRFVMNRFLTGLLPDVWQYLTNGNLVTMARSWVSLWQLLPQGAGTQWAGLDAEVSAFAVASNYQNSDSAVTRGLAAFNAAVNALMAAESTVPAEMICVYSDGSDTLTDLAPMETGNPSFDVLLSRDGDGTVPSGRAKLNGALTVHVPDVKHGAMLSDPTILANVGTWLESAPSDGTDLKPAQQPQAQPAPGRIPTPQYPAGPFLIPELPGATVVGAGNRILRGDP